MKTSNKILLGFALLTLIVLTTCFVVAHSYSKRPGLDYRDIVQLKEEVLSENFSSIKILTPTHITITKSETSKVLFKGLRDTLSSELNHHVWIENDTCYISRKTNEQSPTQFILIDVKNLENIDMAKNSIVAVHGNYNALNIENRGGRLDMNHDIKVKRLHLMATGQSKNHILLADSLSGSLDQAEADLQNITTSINLKMTKSRLSIRNAPNHVNIEKDNSSKVNAN
ncbi:GIN domain-containing protein [Echinicola sp. 20G]|uniref:GIN domain-containing protein n=1 Tax=Echinicola sp. 20G TaxID=2781961 RepID=UPI001910C38B|nr:DUF2807 domain-containing protein [Echinicola sp. 20G]